MKKSTTYTLVLTALMTAILCILSPFSIPLPGLVPISLATLVLYFMIYLLGWKLSTLSFLVYLLLGTVGLPVFSGFGSGIGKLVGPTGGYLIGMFFITILAGWFVEKFQKFYMHLIGMVIATALLYIVGTLWLAHLQQISFWAGLAAGAIPFLPGDAVKIILALIFGPIIRRRLQSAGLLKH